MSAIFEQMTNKAGDDVFPYTRTDGTYTPDGTRLDNELDEIKDNLAEMQKTNPGSNYSIKSHNSLSNMFVCPCDGYLKLIADGAINSTTIVRTSNNFAMAFVRNPSINVAYSNSVFVKKGMKVFCETANEYCDVIFAELS